MKRPRRRNNLLAYALWTNAALLGAILLAVVIRDGGGGIRITGQALAQAPQPIAGGAGLFLMPAQFTKDVWGVYVMDVDGETLLAYQFYEGKKELRLAAARNFRFDRQLRNYNTFPEPLEIRSMVEKEKDNARVTGGREQQQPASGTTPTPQP